MKLERMESLRATVARSLDRFDLDGGIATHSNDELADAALAALGLDDLNAAVERATDWLHESPYSQCNMGSDTCDTRPLARGVLKAALTATDAKGNTDGS